MALIDVKIPTVLPFHDMKFESGFVPQVKVAEFRAIGVWVFPVPVNGNFSRRVDRPSKGPEPAGFDLSGEKRVFGDDSLNRFFESIPLHGSYELGSKPDIAGVVGPVFVEKIFFE